MDSDCILVVDDMPAARQLASRMLTNLGYKVVTATHADEAIELLKGQPYCVLFTDVIMPGSMNGIELAKIAQQYHPNIQVIFSSAYCAMQPEDIAELHATYVAKPYRKTEIASVLRTMLRKKNS